MNTLRTIIAPLLCTATLIAGRASALQDRGLAQEPVTAPTHQDGYARRHALVIGIDRHESKNFSALGTAVHGARSLARLLEDRYGFAAEDVKVLVDSDATLTAIRSALQDRATSQRLVGNEDLFVVYFAGHGTTRSIGDRTRGYLVPFDAQCADDGEPVWSTLLPMLEFDLVSEQMPAKHAVFLLDCCFSGLAATRAVESRVPGLQRRARQVLTAGSEEEQIRDDVAGGHSAFTSALLDALGGRGDLDSDGAVSFGELFFHVSTEVRARVGGSQTPLQSVLSDHRGGNVAFLPKGASIDVRSTAERLRDVETSLRLSRDELTVLRDLHRVRRLTAEVDMLWPATSALLAELERWRSEVREVEGHRARHASEQLRIRQQAILSSGATGSDGASATIDWRRVSRDAREVHEQLTSILVGLDGLKDRDTRMVRRMELIRYNVSPDRDAETRWQEAATSIASLPQYDGLRVRAVEGLLPVRHNPVTGLWEFQFAAGPGSPTLEMVLVPGRSDVSREPASESGTSSRRIKSSRASFDAVARHSFYVSVREVSTSECALFWDAAFYPTARATLLSRADSAEITRRMGLRLPTTSEWNRCAEAALSVVDCVTDYTRPEPDLALELAFVGHFSSLVQWDLFIRAHGPNSLGLNGLFDSTWEWVDGVAYSSRMTASASLDSSGDAPATGRRRALRPNEFRPDLLSTLAGSPLLGNVHDSLSIAQTKFVVPKDFRSPHVGFRVARDV